MTARPRRRIVLLGMMTKMPVGGVIWQTLHYLEGFRRLGCDVYYVEAHGRTPSMLMRGPDDDASIRAAAFLDGIMRRFGMSGRWAFHALHDGGRHFGMSEERLRELYRSADLLINLHGGTQPLPEHLTASRLAYLETDPVQVQIELHHNDQAAIDFLALHTVLFSYAENYGHPDCLLPVSERFRFLPTRQPVVLDLWPHVDGDGGAFTTIGNWKQPWRAMRFRGEVYHWSKHYEFLKFLEVPHRTGQPFELALSGSSYGEEERQLLESKGWVVRDALAFSTDIDAYRFYIASSHGEFTVAKDQNIRLRTGWFSDRSVTYLASGRPVITQETGFSGILPTGEGLFAFSSLEDVERAVDSINGCYERHRRSAVDLAREYFSHDVVLPRLLQDAGL